MLPIIRHGPGASSILQERSYSSTRFAICMMKGKKPVRLSEILDRIEEIADPRMQAEWDKSGLQVTSTRTDFSLLAVFLDPLPHIIERALADGADFLLSHHPLALRPALPNRLDNYYLVLNLLMKANVPLYAAHTSLDVNLEGPAGWLGRELGLVDSEPLEPVGEKCMVGFGVVGRLPAPMREEDLLKQILYLLKLDWAIACGHAIGQAPINRIAYCGGSGASLVSRALEKGAELYITGDVKYHPALESEIRVWDVGHHSIEEAMMERFAALLQRKGLSARFYPSASPFSLLLGEQNTLLERE